MTNVREEEGGGAMDILAGGRDGVTHVFEQVDWSIPQLEGSARFGVTGESWPVSRT